MKNKLSKLFSLIALSASLFMIGCSKDSVDKSNFIFDGDSYFIKHCAIMNMGQPEGDTVSTYKYQIVFSTSTIYYDNVFKRLNSDGDFVEFFMYTINSSTIEQGTYTFDGFKSMNDFTIDDGNITLGEWFLFFNSGVLDFAKRGNIYSFKMDFFSVTNVEGQGQLSIPVSGFYQGPIEVITPTAK